MNNLEGWRFERQQTGWWWYFSHPHDVTLSKASDRAHATLLECVNDGKQQGYMIDAQRRPDFP